MSQGISSIEINNEALRVDKTTTHGVVYLGYAEIGSDELLPVWKIKKITTANGADITWADGNDNYDNVWDDRISLTYL